jgi:hypothetical protein
MKLAPYRMYLNKARGSARQEAMRHRGRLSRYWGARWDQFYSLSPRAFGGDALRVYEQPACKYEDLKFGYSGCDYHQWSRVSTA